MFLLICVILLQCAVGDTVFRPFSSGEIAGAERVVERVCVDSLKGFGAVCVVRSL